MKSENNKNNSQKLLEVLQEKYDNKFIENALEIDGERRRKIKYGKRQISLDEFLNLMICIEENEPGDEILFLMYLNKMNSKEDQDESDLLKKSFINNEIKQI